MEQAIATLVAAVVGALLVATCASDSWSEAVLRPMMEPQVRRARWWNDTWNQADSDRMLKGFRWCFGAFGVLCILAAAGGTYHVVRSLLL